ncbi:CYTH domain-containing protein [Desertivirga brevis]|uniref:CYTH domain-containing protein n=1 Tax=Desertivirga brevis TaxID=2810310 RepID=UPI001A95FCFB|nr:CYTH domain-containing protein [Pedobacter sp. SYSU D00873]
MKFEIERKYLLNKDKWANFEKPRGEFYRQGYILKDPAKTVRVRLTDSNAYITIKGSVEGISRLEYEYEIPLADAIELLDNFCSSELSKTRYKIPFDGKIWEVDEFYGDNEGLILAEIELASEDEVYSLPDWITIDVTGDTRYYNSRLTDYPFKDWKENNGS